MRPCVAAWKNVVQMAELQIIDVRSIGNLPNSCRTKPSQFYAVFQHKKKMIMKILWVIYLGALSRLTATLIPGI
jgi:hypothetical protein